MARSGSTAPRSHLPQMPLAAKIFDGFSDDEKPWSICFKAFAFLSVFLIIEVACPGVWNDVNVFIFAVDPIDA